MGIFVLSEYLILQGAHGRQQIVAPMATNNTGIARGLRGRGTERPFRYRDTSSNPTDHSGESGHAGAGHRKRGNFVTTPTNPPPAAGGEKKQRNGKKGMNVPC